MSTIAERNLRAMEYLKKVNPTKYQWGRESCYHSFYQPSEHITLTAFDREEGGIVSTTIYNIHEPFSKPGTRRIPEGGLN